MNERSSKGAFSLPGKYFTSLEIYQEEQHKIFNNWWLCFGRSEQIQELGSFRRVDFGRENLIISRDLKGTLRAFHNFCRHRGVRLCTELSRITANSIQCPYHAWTYGLDGALLGAPNMKGRDDFDPGDYGLISVPVIEWEGFIFLNLAMQPQPFVEVFKPIYKKFEKWHLPELRIASRMNYQVKANWKLIFQNYSECYHCPTLHPDLNALTPYQNSSNDLEDGPFLGGPMNLVESGESMTISGRACALPIGELAGEETRKVYYYTIFPNLFLSLHPDYVLVHRLEPLAPDCTNIVCEWLFAPKAFALPEFDPSEAVAFWDMTNKQDWHVCELSQQGVSSPAYLPGPYADLESITAAFDRQYLKAIGHG